MYGFIDTFVAYIKTMIWYCYNLMTRIEGIQINLYRISTEVCRIILIIERRYYCAFK